MSTIRKVTLQCAICGNTNEYCVIGSYTQMTSSDLDMRPGETLRTAMQYLPQECPECHYTAFDVAKPCSVSRHFLLSKNYRSCDNLHFKSNNACQFYRIYLIQMFVKDLSSAYDAIVMAAWECDDSGDVNNASYCRSIAIDLADILLQNNYPNNKTVYLQKADFLRRTGQYSRLIREYAKTPAPYYLLYDEEEALKFQIKKARRHDPACYSIDDIM